MYIIYIHLYERNKNAWMEWRKILYIHSIYTCIIRIICRRYIQTKRNEIKMFKMQNEGTRWYPREMYYFLSYDQNFSRFSGRFGDGKLAKENKNERSGRRNSVRRMCLWLGWWRGVEPRAFNCIVENALAAARKSNLLSLRGKINGYLIKN